ncbi:MAG: hypothetical protein ABIJ21_04150 [Nanoarchaeota archaeon]
MKQFIKHFTEKFDYRHVKKIGRRYYYAQTDIAQLPKCIFAAGIYLGEEKVRRGKSTFLPSPALIDLISKTSKRKAIITKEAEWLFLCGRDVFTKSIVKSLIPEGLVLVQNESDENLGYGKIIKGKQGLMIQNILDKGAYLRMER